MNKLPFINVYLILATLLSGYIYAIHHQKFKIKRLDGIKLYMTLFMYGQAFLLFSIAVKLVMVACGALAVEEIPKIGSFLNKFDFYSRNAIAVSLISVVSSIFFSLVKSKISKIGKNRKENINENKRIKAKNIILKNGSTFEKFVLRAINSRAPIQFNLSNDRVYVGFPKDNMRIDDEEAQSFTLLPLVSGYRCHDTQGKIKVTRFYKEDTSVDVEYEMEIFVREIISMSIFNVEMMRDLVKRANIERV